MAVSAIGAWPDNAHLIEAVATMGYLRKEWHTLDPTYGRGNWWKYFRPDSLVCHDLRLDGVDFTALPHEDAEFDAVAFDPPYKLNGTATPDVDERYGVEEYAGWQARHKLVRDGITESLRVTKPNGILLVKCQAQVSSGAVRWQPYEFQMHAEKHGARLIDMFHMVGARAQPKGTRQVHARQNYSTLLVIRKAKKPTVKSFTGNRPRQRVEA